MVPLSGRYRRETQFSNVDLPAPLGPINPTIWPSSTPNEIADKACSPENDSDTPLSSRSCMRLPPQDCSYDVDQTDQAAGQELDAQDQQNAVDHHLRVFELAQELGRQRQIYAPEERAGARMQAADHGHGQKR